MFLLENFCPLYHDQIWLKSNHLSKLELTLTQSILVKACQDLLGGNTKCFQIFQVSEKSYFPFFFSSDLPLLLLFVCLAVLRIKPRALHILRKCFITMLHSSSLCFQFLFLTSPWSLCMVELAQTIGVLKDGIQDVCYLSTTEYSEHSKA